MIALLFNLTRPARRPVGRIFAVATLALMTGASAEPWPKWRGPHGDGISRESMPGPDQWPDGALRTLWKTNVGTGFSSPVVKDGRLYVSGNLNDRDTFYCFDIVKGETLWKHVYESEVWPYLYDGGPNATATLDGDRVFALGRHGHLFVLRPRPARSFGTRICMKNLAWPSLRGASPARRWCGEIGSI